MISENSKKFCVIILIYTLRLIDHRKVNFLISSEREVFDMTENLIKDVKKIQQALINKESIGDEFEEKMEAVHKLEEVADYLKDALGRGIEF